MTAIGFQNDSYQLVETCLARLRVDARLDDDPVLPTIDRLPETDIIEVDISELVIVCDSVRELPSAASIVRQSVKANQNAGGRAQRDVPTLRRTKTTELASTPVKYARWPVILCALVATYFGAAAFIRSPLGKKPGVEHVAKVTRGHIAGAVQATKSLARL